MTSKIRFIKTQQLDFQKQFLKLYSREKLFLRKNAKPQTRGRGGQSSRISANGLESDKTQRVKDSYRLGQQGVSG